MHFRLASDKVGKHKAPILVNQLNISALTFLKIITYAILKNVK